MRRRTLTLELTGLTTVLLTRFSVRAADRLRKIAFLLPDTPDHMERPGSNLKFLLERLADLGYDNGQNVAYDFRFASHVLERLPALAAELVTNHPDVLWTFTSGAARAAAGATSTIPIVVGPVNETTMLSLVDDFGRPRRNITGHTLSSRLQHEKCLQLLKEVVPGVRRVAVLVNPLNPAWERYPDVLGDAARSLGVELVRIEARGPAEIEQAFAAVTASSCDGLFGPSDSTLIGASSTPTRIIELLTKLGLPSVSDDHDFVSVGGLLSISPDLMAILSVAADYIHRILQGAKLGDLPVQHPTKLLVGVNLKTAQVLGIEVPPAVLIRADRVIE